MIQRIVVCDDDAHISLAVTMKLQRAGFDVETYNNGLDAWLAIERQPPDLLVTDWQMPRMGGQDLCRKIAATPEVAGFPILALTAKGLELTEAELEGLGIHQVMNKPFSPRDLLTRVQNALALRAG